MMNTTVGAQVYNAKGKGVHEDKNHNNGEYRGWTHDMGERGVQCEGAMNLNDFAGPSRASSGWKVGNNLNTSGKVRKDQTTSGPPPSSLPVGETLRHTSTNASRLAGWHWHCLAANWKVRVKRPRAGVTYLHE
jgi:hypothetical protein